MVCLIILFMQETGSSKKFSPSTSGRLGNSSALIPISSKLLLPLIILADKSSEICTSISSSGSLRTISVNKRALSTIFPSSSTDAGIEVVIPSSMLYPQSFNLLSDADNKMPSRAGIVDF